MAVSRACNSATSRLYGYYETQETRVIQALRSSDAFVLSQAYEKQEELQAL
jgi:hypothetical protein